MATSDRSTFNLSVASVQGENLGAGEGIFAQKVSGNTLQFKSLVAGTGIQLISGADTITISGGTGGGGGGETNAGINVGSGIGIYTGKTGVNLQFKSLVAGANVGLDDSNPNQITISAATGGGSATARNGLNIDIGGYVVLGGALTGDTFIDTATFGITFGDTNSCATGAHAFATGCRSCALGDRSFASGYIAKACGTASHAEGRQTTASGNYGSHAEGLTTTASGYAAHAEGNTTTASGNYSHAEGTTTSAIGINSHSEGVNTYACGAGSHSQNRLTQACGVYSHAGGEGFSVAKAIFACGSGSFNHSTNTTNQTAGCGANAPYSAILGGVDNYIETGSGAEANVVLGGCDNTTDGNACQSAIIAGDNNCVNGNCAATIGGNNNFATGQGSVVIGGGNNTAGGTNTVIIGGNAVNSAYVNTAVVDNLQIFSTPTTSGGGDQVLLRNGSGLVTQNTCATVSDCRLKTNLQAIDNTIQSLDYINAYVYELTAPSPEAGKTTYGLLAQDVETYFPHAVKENYNVQVSGETQTFKALEYRELVPVLWDIVKKHEARIKTLEALLP